ncbi:RNA polymerase sigma factor [Novipirellula sp. SH528]|uniref:RNA polymerase sigma factor n=1 Tax=Novipirellula sp. SH528 TaxID=3454466 RepID=UPI003FA16672
MQRQPRFTIRGEALDRSGVHASDNTRLDAKSFSDDPPAVDELSDEAIVDRVKSGDLAAFELIMRRYNQRIFRVVRGIVDDDDEADDVVQEAYVRAYEHLDQFSGRSKFSTWLTKIAIYEASWRRKCRRRIQLFDPQEPTVGSIARHSTTQDGVDQMSTSELSRVLRESIDALPETLRLVFMMRIVEGLSTQETAECLSVTESNVKIRLYRARARLRKRIDRELGKESRQLYQFDGRRCDRIVQGVLSRITGVAE